MKVNGKKILVLATLSVLIMLVQIFGVACSSTQAPLTKDNYQDYVTITSEQEGAVNTMIRENVVNIKYVKANPKSIKISVASNEENYEYKDVKVKIKFNVWARYYDFQSFTWSSLFNKEITKEISLDENGSGVDSISSQPIIKELFPTSFNYFSKTYQMGIESYEIVSSSGEIVNKSSEN